jgi:putative transposase
MATEGVMPKPLPVEIRERVVEAVENAGLTIEAAACRFMVGTASVKRWLRRSRESGSVEPDAMGGTRFIWIGEDEREQLLVLVEHMPDATLEELTEAYNARHGTAVSRAALIRGLQRFEVTRKKSASEPRRRSVPTSPMRVTPSRSSSRS